MYNVHVICTSKTKIKKTFSFFLEGGQIKKKPGLTWTNLGQSNCCFKHVHFLFGGAGPNLGIFFIY